MISSNAHVVDATTQKRECQAGLMVMIHRVSRMLCFITGLLSGAASCMRITTSTSAMAMRYHLLEEGEEEDCRTGGYDAV